MIAGICGEKTRGDHHKKIFLHLGVGIDRGDKGILRIELDYLLIFTDGIGDIGSLYLSLSLSIVRMYDIDDLDSLSTIFLDDPLCVMPTIWCSRLSGEEDDDIFRVWVERGLYRDDIFFDDVIGLSIDRDDDNMLEVLSSF